MEVIPNFQAGENYCFFIGFYDYKGYLVNIYNIPCKEGDFGYDVTPSGVNYHRMPISVANVETNQVLTQYILTAKLNTSDVQTLTNNNITSYSIFFVEHNYNNSRVLSNCICVRDMVENVLSENQTYKGLFDSNDKVRVYPYEYMFNNQISINCKVRRLSYGANLQRTGVSYVTYDGQSNYFEKVKSDDTNVQWEYPMPEESITYPDFSLVFWRWVSVYQDNISETAYISSEVNLEYVAANNSQQNNQAGESYFRGDNTNSIFIANNANTGSDKFNNGGTGTARLRFAFVQLMNVGEDTGYYNVIDDQKLQIASGIIPLNQTANLRGDGYIGLVTLRLTAPTSGYRYGDSSQPEADSNLKTWRWIITYPTDSKFNLNARFNANAVDTSYKEAANSTDASRYTIYDKNYAIDNLINNEIGKGYSLIYNNNGSESFPYGNNYIDLINSYINRIVRSSVNNTESTELGWRYYRTNDYKDVGLNRGSIVSLKNNTKHLYIQQEYGLKLISIRDTLGSTEEGISYVSSSDIFDMEPVDVLYSPTGYIGCSNQFDNLITINGYYVIDSEKGKIFQVDGSSVREISSTKCKKWFERNIIHSSNNPYVDNGRFIFFDEDYMNLHIIQKYTANPFNLHYNNVVQRWISFEEDYNNIKDVYRFTTRIANLYIQRNNGIKLYIKDENKYRDCIIKTILNDSPLNNKLLETIVWKDTVSKLRDGVRDIYWDRTISKLAVHTEDQCSGYLDVVANDYLNQEWYDGSKGANKINLWRFNNILDVALNNHFLKTEVTFEDNNLNNNLEWFEKNKLYNQFFYVIFKYEDSTKEYKWELQEVMYDYSLDNRNNQTMNEDGKS